MSMGILVSYFGDIMRSRPMQETSVEASVPFPEDLAHVREICGHHIVLLTLLAQSDGERDPAEIQEILIYCVDKAQSAGIVVGASQRASLESYLRDFRASRIQLEPALKRLHRDTKADFSALLAAAQSVIEADGTVSQEESQLFEKLREGLKSI